MASLLVLERRFNLASIQGFSCFSEVQEARSAQMVLMAASHMQTTLSLEAAAAILHNQTGRRNASDALCTLLKSLLSDICHRTLLASTMSFILLSAREAVMLGKCSRAELLTRPYLMDEDLGRVNETEVALEDDYSLVRCRAGCFNEPLQTPEVVHKVPGKEFASWILVAKNKDDEEDADEDEDEDDEEDDEDDLEDDEEGEGGDEEVEGGDGGEDDDEEGDDDDDGEDEDDVDDEEEDEDEDEDEEDESPPKKMKK